MYVSRVAARTDYSTVSYNIITIGWFFIIERPRNDFDLMISAKTSRCNDSTKYNPEEKRGGGKQHKNITRKTIVCRRRERIACYDLRRLLYNRRGCRRNDSPKNDMIR